MTLRMTIDTQFHFTFTLSILYATHNSSNQIIYKHSANQQLYRVFLCLVAQAYSDVWHVMDYRQKYYKKKKKIKDDW